MAASVSKWTQRGSDTNATIVSENPGDASDVLNTIVRHEMHMWLDDDAAITSDPLGFPIRGDLTVVFNSTKVDLSGTIGNCTATMEGSVDGTNYDTLQALGTTTFDGAVVAYQFDKNASGVMPYMRLSVTPASDVDNTAKPIKINIFETNTV